jgi:hypothetical protein
MVFFTTLIDKRLYAHKPNRLTEILFYHLNNKKCCNFPSLKNFYLPCLVCIMNPNWGIGTLLSKR